MNKKLWIFLISLFVSACLLHAEDVALDLQMPSHLYSPGMTFKLDLHVQNAGEAYDDCGLFVALTIGTGEYWFYPSWCRYPDDVDWEEISIDSGAEFTKSILPAFQWPEGAGEFSGAMFLAAVVYENTLISNLAETTFGWTEAAPDFVKISAGTFQMGSPDDELCRKNDEGPLHTVKISNGFYIQAREVTQQQWVDMFGTNPSGFSDCMECPVDNVTWFDCCVYCNRLSLEEGLTPCYYADDEFSTVFDGTPPVESGMVYWKQDANGYRLPTEAEWEYACRAGTSTAYYSGQDISDCLWDSELDPLAWYDNNSGLKTHPVGEKQANGWGLYDMLGNASEWCWDYYAFEYYETSPSTDPTGPETGVDHVARGGSYNMLSRDCRAAARLNTYPGNQYSGLGFRPVKSGE